MKKIEILATEETVRSEIEDCSLADITALMGTILENVASNIRDNYGEASSEMFEQAFKSMVNDKFLSKYIFHNDKVKKGEEWQFLENQLKKLSNEAEDEEGEDVDCDKLIEKLKDLSKKLESIDEVLYEIGEELGVELGEDADE